MPSLVSLEGLSEDLWEIFWRRRWVVLGMSLLALVGGFLRVQRTTSLNQLSRIG